MGADEIAVIRPALLELEAALAGPAMPGTGPLCASFAVEPSSTPWVEVVLGATDTLNISYPFAAPPLPLDRLRHLSPPAPSDLDVAAHKPGVYATFSFSRPPAMELARFIDAIFVELLGCSGDEYPLTVSLFHLPPQEVSP
jgi:hypothetical protein